MTFHSEPRQLALYRRLSQTIALPEVLDLLASEIDRVAPADGFVINLHDPQSDCLVSHKIRFTPEFHFLNETYIGYKIGLDSDYLNARAFRTRCRLFTDHERASDGERKLLEIWKLRSMAALPLCDPESRDAPVLGTVLLLSAGEPIADDTLDAVEELAAMFYRPILNAHEHAIYRAEYERARAVTAEHDRFLRFIVEINNLTAPRKIYEMFKDELFRQFGFEVLSFFMLEDDALVGEYMAVNNDEFDDICPVWYEHVKSAAFSTAASDGGIPHVFAADAPLLFRDVQQILSLPMSDKDRALLRVMGPIRTLLMLPVRYQHHPIGVMSLCTLSGRIEVGDADISLLTYLASFLGTAIVNSKQYEFGQRQNREIERLNLILQDRVEELSQQVTVDRLTGLHNYRSFQHEFARRVAESRRDGDWLGVSLAVIDIDHFKRFNDSYGHAAGNAVLAAVAREIAALTRQQDLACRYGGEEFVVILPQCDTQGALQFAARVRESVERCVVATVAGELSVTVSIGCATHRPNESDEELFHRADQALYQAKKNGRNRVELG